MEVKQKLAYIVTENGCMNPQSGAYQHIAVGMRELGKHFEVVPFLPSCPPSIPAAHVKRDRDSYKQRGALYGALRDLRDLWRVSLAAWKVSSHVKRAGCTMAYVRVQALSPVTLLLRLRGVHTFLEANGLQFESRRARFNSLFLGCYEPYERWIYSRATHVFFVGSYGDYWKFTKGNWTNVENGIENDFIGRFSKPRTITGGPLRLAFVGSLMPHHRPDVLIEALKEFAVGRDVELHLIGSKLDTVVGALQGVLKVVDHGFLEREQLSCVLETLDIGLISGAPEYQSQMKLFDYGSARMPVVAPDTHHLKSWYRNEIHFFQGGNAKALAAALAELDRDREHMIALGSSLHERIRGSFTWDRVFASKAKVIKSVFRKI